MVSPFFTNTVRLLSWSFLVIRRRLTTYQVTPISASSVASSIINALAWGATKKRTEELLIVLVGPCSPKDVCVSGLKVAVVWATYQPPQKGLGTSKLKT